MSIKYTIDGVEVIARISADAVDERVVGSVRQGRYRQHRGQGEHQDQ